MSYPVVMRAALASHCPHCHLPVDIGEPISLVGPQSGSCMDSRPCTADFGWEHAFHHAGAIAAGVKWGLFSWGDNGRLYPT